MYLKLILFVQLQNLHVQQELLVQVHVGLTRYVLRCVLQILRRRISTTHRFIVVGVPHLMQLVHLLYLFVTTSLR